MKLRYLFFAAAVSTLAAACSEVDELASSSSQKTLETIQSGTDNFTTRVNLDSQWEAGDAIGVYMLDAGTGNIRNSAMNIQYNAEVTTTSTTTDFVAANGGGIGIYDQPCDFKAYYPYSSNEDGKVDMGAGLYNIDLSDQTDGISAHDLMWAEANGMETADLQNSGLSLTFRHKLVLLRVHVKGNVTAENVTVSGLNTVATFDLLSGTLSEGSTPKLVSLYRTDEKNVFMGIMLPTTELRNKMKLSITTADGKKYQYTVPNNSNVDRFVGGCEYNYTINVESDDSSLEGGDGGNEPWQPGGDESGDGDEVLDNEDIPEGYTQVTVVSSDANLTELLNSNKGSEKVALIFPEGNYTSGKITVPAEVKELLFISETENQPKLELTGGVAWEGTTLDKLAFNNMEITGDGVKLVEENCAFADNGMFEIKKCYIHDMTDILSIAATPATKLASFTVDDCQITKVSSLFFRYAAEVITIINSTLYDMEYTANSNAMSTIRVENSTLVGLRTTPFENSGRLTFNNNIIACFTSGGDKQDNLTYSIKGIDAFSGNYAAAPDDDSLLPMIEDSNKTLEDRGFEDAWVDKNKTVTELFKDAAAGDFTTTITDAGDPRWRQGAQ